MSVLLQAGCTWSAWQAPMWVDICTWNSERALWAADRDLGDAHADLVTESPEWIG